MNIGATIKKLRYDKEITQEQLAAYLKVTAQAISRWETGSALPDITQVPALAHIFNVSADELLGVDIAAREARIDAIVADAWDNYAAKGHTEEAVAMLRNALEKYPNSYKLMDWLMTCIQWNTDPKPANEAARREIVAIGEKILAGCNEDAIRHSAIQSMCYAYVALGEHEKARALAEKMPSIHRAQEELLTPTLKGAELRSHRQNVLLDYLDIIFRHMLHHNLWLFDENHPFTADEQILVHQKMLDICCIFFENGDYGFYHLRIGEMHKNLAQLHLGERNDVAAALAHVRWAKEHAIAFDTAYDPEKEHSSLLFRGRKFGVVSSNVPGNQSNQLLSDMQAHYFDPIREEKVFIEIENELRNCAKKEFA